MYTLRVLAQDLEYEIEPSLVKSWSNLPWYSWCFQPRTSNIYINLGKFETMGADVGRAATGLAYLQDPGLGATVRHGPCDEMMREKYCTQDIQEVFRDPTNHAICASSISSTWVLMEKI